MSPADPPPLEHRHGGLPRWLEALAAGGGLLLVAPLLAAAALAVKLNSPGPILFRQQRIGRGGRPFLLYKLRSMTIDQAGPGVTAGGDARVTRVGALLRRSKLDELPELWNVLRGDMSLVGARPEVPQFVNLNDELWQQVLVTRPGLTDPVTLALRDEESLLRNYPEDPERYYREQLLPRKLAGYVAYQRQRNSTTDSLVLAWTVLKIVMPSVRIPPSLDYFKLDNETQTTENKPLDKN